MYLLFKAEVDLVVKNMNEAAWWWGVSGRRLTKRRFWAQTGAFLSTVHGFSSGCSCFLPQVWFINSKLLQVCVLA